MKISDKKKIRVTFLSIDQTIKLNIYCYNSDIFLYVEEEVYRKAPNLKNKYYFLNKGKIIDKYLTIAQNEIEDKDIILIAENEYDLDELMAIIFNYNGIKFAIPCNINDLFSVTLEKLYQKYPELKEKELYFLHAGNVIKKSSTLKENHIRMGNHVLIQEI